MGKKTVKCDKCEERLPFNETSEGLCPNCHRKYMDDFIENRKSVVNEEENKELLKNETFHKNNK